MGIEGVWGWVRGNESMSVSGMFGMMSLPGGLWGWGWGGG